MVFKENLKMVNPHYSYKNEYNSIFRNYYVYYKNAIAVSNNRGSWYFSCPPHDRSASNGLTYNRRFTTPGVQYNHKISFGEIPDEPNKHTKQSMVPARRGVSQKGGVVSTDRQSEAPFY